MRTCKSKSSRRDTCWAPLPADNATLRREWLSPFRNAGYRKGRKKSLLPVLGACRWVWRRHRCLLFIYMFLRVVLAWRVYRSMARRDLLYCAREKDGGDPPLHSRSPLSSDMWKRTSRFLYFYVKGHEFRGEGRTCPTHDINGQSKMEAQHEWA